MSRDYAKTRRAPARPRSGSTIPGWVWLLTGLVTGAFVMFLVYLSGLAPTPTETAPAHAQPAPIDTTALEKPIFEFYDTLMNSEIIASASTLNPENASHASASPPVYMLQVASYRKFSDADALKAQLILEGLESSIAEFNNRGEIYHRVMVGPFNDTTHIEQAKKILASHNLNPIVLQRKSLSN